MREGVKVTLWLSGPVLNYNNTKRKISTLNGAMLMPKIKEMETIFIVQDFCFLS